MTALTGSDTYFTDIDSDFTATKWETLIDQAIDKINGYAKTTLIRNMTGVAGAKTVTLTSMQIGFVRSLAARLYNVEYKMPGSNSLGILSETVADLTMELERLAKAAAAALTENDWSRAFI